MLKKYLIQLSIIYVFTFCPIIPDNKGTQEKEIECVWRAGQRNEKGNHR